MMVLKINQYFRKHIDILKQLVSIILSWKSKGFSDESIKSPSTSNKMLNSSVNYAGTKARVEFKGDCLKQDKILFDHGKIVNI